MLSANQQRAVWEGWLGGEARRMAAAAAPVAPAAPAAPATPIPPAAEEISPFSGAAPADR